MQILQTISLWLTGGPNHQYMALAGCMRRDYFWIGVTVTLDLMVAVGYVIIAYHWSRNEKSLPPSPARTALRTMRNIFAFCGICGYLFIPVKMFWPAWRLYDMFMVALVFYTWQYALNARNLKVIYTAIGRSNQLAEDLAQSREESKRKSFFLNAISHDLRTPLNGLALHADLAELQIGSADFDSVKQSLNEIKAGVRLTADLLDGLLEYARLETAVDQPVIADFDLGDLINDVLNSHAAMAAKKSLALFLGTCPSIIMRTDRLRLERILNNLVGNAIKFTDSGSIRVDVECSRNDVSVSVSDTGIGISPGHQARLFDEFFQVQNHERDRQKGFGLGLAICHRLARQLDGELRVKSDSGKGQLLYHLPPRGGSIPPIPTRCRGDRKRARSRQPAGGKCFWWRMTSSAPALLAAILRRRDFDVIRASTIADALKLLNDEISVVVLDLMLPDGDGQIVLKIIRERGLTPRVFVTTAVSDPERLHELAALAPDVILQKPIDLPRLLGLMQPLH